jgi:6-phospho-beta-glucosidase
MTRNMKLTVVGGGSTYTPELIDGFCRYRSLFPIEELWLVDPDEERLRLVGGMSRRMFEHAGHPGKIVTTTNLVEGVRDADDVIIQLRVGGQDARRGDETFPHECGLIGQETTGPGGFAKALRTVPVVLKVADAVRRYAKPDAWIVDFTNPVGIVTRALLTAGHHAIGLCNVAIGFQRHFAGMLDVQPEQVRLGHVGLNHLTWERSIDVTTDGKTHDALPGLMESRMGELAEHIEMDPSLIRLLHAIPSYYLRYYYAHDEVLAEQLGSRTRAEVVQEVERALLAIYGDGKSNTKPKELEKRGGAYYSEAAVDLLASLRADRGDIQVVNLRNDGLLPFLPDDHVVEVPARVGADGVKAEPVAPLPSDLSGLIEDVAGYERLALDAAIHGGRERVLHALVAHPLVRQYDKAQKLTDLLIAGNREHLAWAQ